MDTLREVSRKDFSTADHQPTHVEISTGCMQRIANATEMMAKNFTQLQSDRDMYMRWYEEGRARLRRAERRSCALRGVITKLKRKLEQK